MSFENIRKDTLDVSNNPYRRAEDHCFMFFNLFLR
jgi:hypothetical protein